MFCFIGCFLSICPRRDRRFTVMPFLHFLSLPHRHRSHWDLYLSPSWLTLSIISYLSIASRNPSTPLRKPNSPRVSVKTLLTLSSGGLGGEQGWWKGKDYSPNLHWKSMLPHVRSSHWKGNRQRCLSQAICHTIIINSCHHVKDTSKFVWREFLKAPCCSFLSVCQADIPWGRQALEQMLTGHLSSSQHLWTSPTTEGTHCHWEQGSREPHTLLGPSVRLHNIQDLPYFNSPSGGPT